MKWFSWSTKHTEQQRIEEEQIAKLMHKERLAEFRLQEAAYNFAANIVNPCDDLIDPETGEQWELCGSGGYTSKQKNRDWRWYENMRGVSRWLTLNSAWAQNVQDNRVSYIVGSGHQYDISPVDIKNPASVAATEAVRDAFDEFRKANTWEARQQNNQERLDRDGVVFIRIVKSNGTMVLRYIEPEHIRTPEKYKTDENVRFGIRNAPGDVETIESYYVWSSDASYEEVPAEEIQQRNRGVDIGDPLGIAIYWSISKNLYRADKLLRNKSVLVELQTAIGMIRKQGGNKSEIEAFQRNNATVSATNSTTGNTRYGKRYSPGTILDAPQGTDYEFPAQSLNVANYDAITKEELRAVASRVIMPEYMVTADASNSAYASTLVAEGPAVKNFEKQQSQMIAWDLELFDMLIAMKAEDPDSDITDADKDLVNINVTPPRTQVRDRKADTEADEILVTNKAMSVETMSERAGLNPVEEGKRIIARTDAEFNLVPTVVGDEEDNEEPNNTEEDDGTT